MSWILRSPIHGMLSNGMMLITVIGRKSGRRYTTPVGYTRDGQHLWVISSRDRTWWKNVQGGARVDLLLGRKPVVAHAETVMNEAAVAGRLNDYLRRMPMAARQLGIRMQDGLANTEDIQRVAAERMFVKISLAQDTQEQR